MGLFKPKYLNTKKNISDRKRALEKEKNTSRLKEVAVDPKIDDGLRDIAIRYRES